MIYLGNDVMSYTFSTPTQIQVGILFVNGIKHAQIKKKKFFQKERT